MHKVFQKIVILFVILLISNLSYSSPMVDPVPTFPEEYEQTDNLDLFIQEANEAYRNNNLEKALIGYLYLTERNIKNGYLYYNIGNTYLRLGDLGKSILWYERALEFLPRYNDLLVNLNYARNQIVDEEFLEPSYGSSIGFFLYLYNLITVRELLMITLFLFWLFIGCLVVYYWISHERLRSRIRIPCWMLGILFIISILSSGYKIYRYEYIDEAIIMRSAVDIKTAPSDEFSTAFTLHEGTKVMVEQQQNNWVRISMPGNRAFTGWIPEESIELI